MAEKPRCEQCRWLALTTRTPEWRQLGKRYCCVKEEPRKLTDPLCESFTPKQPPHPEEGGRDESGSSNSTTKTESKGGY